MQLSNLDSSQRFNQLQIESEDKRIHLKNVTFQQSMMRLQQVVEAMQQSHFFKNITVHFGAKTPHNTIYLQQHYQRKIQLLKLQLEEEKEHLKDIISAADQDDLEIKELEHRKNQLFIEDQKKQIKNPDFHPCLFVQANRKKPIYGQITQQFSRKGMGNFVAKLGYRAPFRTYDTLELDLQWPINTSFRPYYQAYLDWSNKLKLGTSHFRFGGTREPTFRSIDSRISSISWALQREHDRFEVQLAHRKPFIHEEIFHNMKQQFYEPSRKVALKYHRTLFNTIKFQDVSEGSYGEIKAELGLPFLGQTNFLKMEYSFRKFIDTFKARQWVEHPWIRKLLWKSTLQLNFSAVALAQFRKKCYLNDVLDSLQVRGFQPLRQPHPTYGNIKSSLKFNIHNYPLLLEARIVSFLYAQAGVSFLKENPFKPLSLCSTGLGLSFYAGPSAQIQILCNLAQWQSKASREPVGFQVRFGIFD